MKFHHSPLSWLLKNKNNNEHTQYISSSGDLQTTSSSFTFILFLMFHLIIQFSWNGIMNINKSIADIQKEVHTRPLNAHKRLQFDILKKQTTNFNSLKQFHVKYTTGDRPSYALHRWCLIFSWKIIIIKNEWSSFGPCLPPAEIENEDWLPL